MSAALEGFEIHAAAVRSIRPSLGNQWQNSGFILALLDGELTLEHYGRKVALRSGDMALLDSKEACSIDVFDKAHAFTVSMSRASFLGLRARPEFLFGVHLSSTRSICRILLRTIKSVVRDDCSDPGEARAIRSAILTLLEEALHGAHSAVHCDARSRRQIEKMREWVARDPGNSQIDADMLARTFGMSRRSLYRLFATLGTTPGRWINDVRLDQAYRYLFDGGADHGSVSQVAFAAGFSDSSHFARAFRRRFGVSPSECRALPSGAAPPSWS